MASLADLENLLGSLGAPAALIPKLAAIPTAEDTSGSPTATNTNTDGTTDVGFWQINSSNFAWLTQVLGTPVNAQTLSAPDQTLNAKAAIALATQTPNGLSNWATWNAYSDAAAGATGLTAGQQAAAQKISAALGAINAGNAGATTYGSDTINPNDWIIPPNPSIGFPGLSKNPFYMGQNSVPPSVTGGPGSSISPTQFWTNLTAWIGTTWFSPGALAVIALAIALLIVAGLIAKSSSDSSTNVTIAPPVPVPA